MYVRSCALSDAVAARIWCQQSTGTCARAAIEAASVFGAGVRAGALARCSAALPPPQPATASSASTSPSGRFTPAPASGRTSRVRSVGVYPSGVPASAHVGTSRTMSPQRSAPTRVAADGAMSITTVPPATRPVPPLASQEVLGIPLALTDYARTLDWIDAAV